VSDLPEILGIGETYREHRIADLQQQSMATIIAIIVIGPVFLYSWVSVPLHDVTHGIFLGCAKASVAFTCQQKKRLANQRAKGLNKGLRIIVLFAVLGCAAIFFPFFLFLR
jgi:hypothetical protein